MDYDVFYDIARRIPKGKVMTYKQVAEASGFPNSWRQVARAMKHNKDPDKIPCYRIVGSDGRVHGPEKEWRRKRLEEEGIEFNGNKIDLRKFSFSP